MIKVQMRSSLQRALDFLVAKIKEEIEAQGHRASGKLIDTISTNIIETNDGFVGQILMQDYSLILDKGVSRSRVPYSRGSGAGSSRYIDALIDWIKIIKPGLTDRENKSFAFAIANNAKKEGHPTVGSYSYTRNGRRKEWSKYAIDNNIQSFEELLELGKAVAAAYASIDVRSLLN